ncbi:vacuolar protein sorting-associated protein 13 family protein, partial [Trypanosoma theileri]
MKVHALSSGEKGSMDKNCALSRVIAVPLQHFRIDVAPMTVKLADPLLFILRQAGTCVLETVNQSESITSDHKNGEEQNSENNNHDNHHNNNNNEVHDNSDVVISSTSEGPFIYNCHI